MQTRVLFLVNYFHTGTTHCFFPIQHRLRSLSQQRVQGKQTPARGSTGERVFLQSGRHGYSAERVFLPYGWHVCSAERARERVFLPFGWHACSAERVRLSGCSYHLAGMGTVLKYQCLQLPEGVKTHKIAF